MIIKRLPHTFKGTQFFGNLIERILRLLPSQKIGKKKAFAFPGFLLAINQNKSEQQC